MVGVNCKEAGEMFSLSLDRQLAREEELNFQEHLKDCPACRREWSEWLRVAEALRQFDQGEIKAPVGFSAAVMARIESEKLHPVGIDWKRWKQAAIGVAATLLLAAGSLLIRTDNLVQVADRDKQINLGQKSPIQSGNDIKPVNSGMTGQESKQTSVSQPVGNNGSSSSAPADSSSGSQNTPGIAEFASEKNHIIVSTFLTIKVTEARKAEAEAINLAWTCSASIQSLGQQSQGGVVYLVDKIVVEGNRSQQLINNLSGLGVCSITSQKEDLTQRYSETYAQWISLKNQRGQTRDSEQVAVLDRQISQVEAQLQSWDKQTSQQTIVLWLQQ